MGYRRGPVAVENSDLQIQSYRHSGVSLNPFGKLSDSANEPTPFAPPLLSKCMGFVRQSVDKSEGL